MTVRNIYVDEVRKKWDLKGLTIFNISETDHIVAGISIMEKIGSHPVHPTR
jgi:hypothetical protein